MKFSKFKFLFTAFVLLALAVTSCDEQDATSASLTNYVGMEASKFVSVHPSETVTVESSIYATNISNVDRTYALIVDPATTHDPAYYTVPATVTIPAGEKVGTFQVGITGEGISEDGNKIILGLEQLPGVDQGISGFTAVVPDGAPIGTFPVVTGVTLSKVTILIDKACDFNKVRLSITFDNYPEETAWELYDNTATVIASGGIDDTGTITGYAALGFADRSTYKTSFCLTSGDYTFVIYDDYGDGMFTSADVQGTYTVKLGDTVLASGGGDFGTFQDTAFTLP
jgi:hypothetical protein